MRELCLVNGKIYIERGRFEEALLIRGETVSAVGSAENMKALSPGAEIIDCGGKTVVPGFNDSHLHFTETAFLKRKAPISGVRSNEELVSVCRKFMSGHPSYCRRGMLAGGWNQDRYTGEKRLPTRADLDRISTDVPVCLERVCGHIVAVNSVLLRMMGLPEGHDGLLYGNDCNIAKSFIPPFSDDEIREMLLEEMRDAAALGLTSFQSNDVGTSTENADGTFALIRSLYEDGSAPLRFGHQVCFNDIAKFRAYLSGSERRQPVYSGNRLTLGPLKLFRDGSFGARTALMREEYPSGGHGLAWMSDDEADAFIAAADEAGMQVVTHAIGDLAVEKTVASYEKVIRGGTNPNRHGIVHCAVTQDDLIERIAAGNIYVFAQPVFLNSDIPVIDSALPRSAADAVYRYAEMYRRGIHVSLGTDSPVESCSPLQNICYAMGGADGSGRHCRGFVPMTAEEAIDAYTYESAFAQFKENEKGRLMPGYLADLVILDRDVFTCPVEEIRNISPVLTMVGGQTVWEKK